jgi:DNA polymerase III epsilon subunit-like protein
MIVLDVETTGVDFKKNSIVSIGALDFFNPLNQFYAECRVFEDAEITEQALAVNGFTREQVLFTNKYSLEEAVLKYLDWSSNIREKTLAGENPRFDRDFLNASSERYGLKRIPFRTIDLHTLSYIDHLLKGVEIPLKEGVSDINLDSTLNYVGLPSEPVPHNALTGAKFEAEALSRIIYGKNLLDEFKKFEIPDYLRKL